MTLLEIVLICVLIVETIVLIVAVYSFFKLKKMLTSSLLSAGGSMLEAFGNKAKQRTRKSELKLHPEEFGVEMQKFMDLLQKSLEKEMKESDQTETPPRKMKGGIWGPSDSDANAITDQLKNKDIGNDD